MSRKPPLTPPEQAWQLIEPHLVPLAPETVQRREALWRVLQEDLRATVDVPSVDVSAMDGFALAGPAPEGRRLPVLGTVAAGARPGAGLEPGSAWRIMTGAPMPLGADRVIPVELTDTVDGAVVIRESPATGAHIRRRGEVVRRGAPLLAAGTILTPGALGLLAAHGIETLPVVGRPQLAVLATGNEVVPPEVEPEPGQVRDSHTDFFLAAGASVGCTVESLGIAPDEHAALRSRVERGLANNVLILSGGVSMGEFDLVEGVLAELGCRILFDAVAIQPGKPVVGALHPGGFVFGLPGNPASAMVTFWLFVRPVLRRLMGLDDGFWHGALRGRLVAPLPAAKGRDLFLPAEIHFAEGDILVRPVAPAGSHDVSAYGAGTALVRVPANAPERPPGQQCEILPLADWRAPAHDRDPGASGQPLKADDGGAQGNRS